ncbi:MAG: nucleotide exchange factor GrpE [Planctomycetaceae bacterium]
MSDSAVNLESVEEASVADEAPPEFGLIDVVEAFTAMRHEWRGQTKESQALAESLQAAVLHITELEAKLVALTAGSSHDEARKLAELVIDVDHQLTRAIAVAAQSEANRRLDDERALAAIRAYFEGMHLIARRFARPLLTFVINQRSGGGSAPHDGTIEGLNLLLARLRRAMKEHQLLRIETLGRPFDAETMNAIGTVESADHPAGHVAEQLSPAYRWRGSLLRCADVRVAS